MFNGGLGFSYKVNSKQIIVKVERKQERRRKDMRGAGSEVRMGSITLLLNCACKICFLYKNKILRYISFTLKSILKTTATVPLISTKMYHNTKTVH